jgi:hypothetical protein
MFLIFIKKKSHLYTSDSFITNTLFPVIIEWKILYLGSSTKKTNVFYLNFVSKRFKFCYTLVNVNKHVSEIIKSL